LFECGHGKKLSAISSQRSSFSVQLNPTVVLVADG